MIIDLALIRLQGKPLRVEREFSPESLALDSEILRLNGPVSASTEIRVTGERVRALGQLEAEVELTCCRCLKTMIRHISKSYRLEYRPDPESSQHHEESLKYGDLGIGFYHQDKLDLNEVIGEQVLLEIPMNPICRDDCKGLCDQCGQDLNQAECRCTRERVDPRWAVLEGLKRKLEH